MAIRETARRKLTYEDYLLFPDDGNRHEILDGEHYVSPAPKERHPSESSADCWLGRHALRRDVPPVLPFEGRSDGGPVGAFGRSVVAGWERLYVLAILGILLPVAHLRSLSPEVITFRDPGRRKNTCATLSAKD